MELSKETAILEAILLLESEPVTLDQLAKIAKLDRTVIESCVGVLNERYADEAHGIELVQLAEGYVLQPKLELWENLRDRYGKRNENKLSRAAIETLSIIAYSQPITRAEIEGLRGVSPDGMIRLLLQRELIQEIGRKDAPGRPVQYGTTNEFLKLFRLASIKDLPRLDEQDRRRFELEDSE